MGEIPVVVLSNQRGLARHKNDQEQKGVVVW